MRERLRRRRTVLLVLIGYTLVIGVITLTPGSPDPHHDGPVGRLLELFARHPVTRWMTFDRAERLANVAMFVPFGFLSALLCGRRWWLAVVVGAAYSCLIEGTQATILAASRVADVGDLITNTLGAAIGAALAVAVLRVRARRR